MRLSRTATELLKNNEITELRALSLEHLLYRDDFLNIQRALANSSDETASMSFANDAVSYQFIEDPVVVLTNGAEQASAYIYSKASIQEIVRVRGENPRDPLTNLPLMRIANQQQDNNRVRDVDEYCVELSILSQAMAQLQALRAQRDNHPPIESLSTTGTCSMELKISRNKLRVVFSEGDHTHNLAQFLLALFEASPNARIASPDGSPVTSYSAKENKYARLWNENRLDFWFPLDSELITDELINNLLLELLKPLSLPEAPLSEDISYGTISQLGLREYKSALPEAIRVSPRVLADCLSSFYNAVGAFASAHEIALCDEVMIRNERVTPAQHTGVMLFGAPPAGAASAPSNNFSQSTFSMRP